MALEKETKEAVCKAEALRRMTQMGLSRDAINRFDKDNSILLSDAADGSLHELCQLEKDIVLSIEAYYHCMVYHVMREMQENGHSKNYYLFVDHAFCAFERADQKQSEKLRELMPVFKDANHVKEGIVSAHAVNRDPFFMEDEADFVFASTDKGGIIRIA